MNTETPRCPGCELRWFKWVTRTHDYDYHTTDMEFVVAECEWCGVRYLYPRPTIEELGKVYPKEYSAYHFTKIANPLIRMARNFMQTMKARKILRSIPKDVGFPCILDVGCGSPALLKSINEKASGPVILFGNDFNDEVLQEIKNEGLNAVPGRFEDVDLTEKSFDVIVMNQVLEHVYDVGGALDKARQLLKDTGVLFIEIPSTDGIDARLFKYHNWGGYHAPRHLSYFNAAKLTKVLAEHGFKVKKVEYLPSPTFWTSSFRNLLRGIPFIAKRMNYKNMPCMAFFTVLDLMTRTFFPTSNMRIIAGSAGLIERGRVSNGR